MSLWNDFNDAQSNANVIPKGTLAKVRLTIRPGGFDDPSQGWTGGYAKRGASGAVYLDAEYTVLEGPFAKRKIWSLIGLYSPKGPDWANMGRGLLRGILNSARGLSDKDKSPEAQAARRISGFADLDGLEFVARIDIGTDTNGEDKNEVRSAVTPDHKDYAALMGKVAPTMQAPGLPGHTPPATGHPGYSQAGPAPQGYAPQHQPSPQPQPSQAPTGVPSGRPSWAE
jgi:hypothetical protein